MNYSRFMIFVALTISVVAEYFSIVGLMAIFPAAALPVAVMGISLALGKLTTSVWLKANWKRCPTIYKFYLIPAIIFLMLLTSIGCIGYLSKAHNDHYLVSSGVQSKLAIYDEKIRVARENIDSDRKQLKQMDDAVEQILVRSSTEAGATRATALRKSQQQDHTALTKDIETQQSIIQHLNEEAEPIRAENRKVEAEVGPIKYIAEFFADGQIVDLDRAVRWMIVIIVLVFDPLAILMLIAANINYDKDRAPTLKSVEELQKNEEPKHIAPAVGQTVYNPANNSTVWWTGSEWAPLPSTVKEPIDLQEKIVIQPEIKVYPPNIDTEIIKTVVASSMDSWLDTASVKTNTTQPFAEQEKNNANEPETEKTIEEPIDELPDSSYTNTEDTFHPQEHFKPTHITYGRRV